MGSWSTTRRRVLKRVDRQRDVVARYVRRQKCAAEPRSNDEPNRAVLELLVRSQRTQNLLARKISRQARREFEAPQRPDDSIAFIQSESSFPHRNFASRDDPERDSFAMQHCSVTRRPFNRMTNRVPKVEHGTSAGEIALVLRDYTRLDLDVARDEFA